MKNIFIFLIFWKRTSVFRNLKYLCIFQKSIRHTTWLLNKCEVYFLFQLLSIELEFDTLPRTLVAISPKRKFRRSCKFLSFSNMICKLKIVLLQTGHVPELHGYNIYRISHRKKAPGLKIQCGIVRSIFLPYESTSMYLEHKVLKATRLWRPSSRKGVQCHSFEIT